MVGMLRTALSELVDVEVPVIGAPMAGVSAGRLAAAVSAAGGLGMLGVGGATDPEWIRREGAVAADAGAAFGIGLMAWVLQSRPEQFDATVAAGPRLVSISFGDYARWVEPLNAAGIAVATQVGDVAGARAAVENGVDVVVARGSEAGGHGLDAVATLPLLQGVLEAVDIPVLAAGGIATGRGLAAVLAAGAAGAWIGTALLNCPEATNSAAARSRIRGARETDTVYSRVFDVAQGLGWPTEYGGRALRNSFTDRWAGREQELASDDGAREQLAAARAAEEFDTAYVYAGQAVGLVGEQRPAGEVVASIAAEAERLLRRW